MGKAALDDPALATQAGAVRDAATRDDGRDVARAQQAAVLVEVVAAVGEHDVGFWRGRPILPATGRACSASSSGMSWVTS